MVLRHNRGESDSSYFQRYSDENNLTRKVREVDRKTGMEVGATQTFHTAKHALDYIENLKNPKPPTPADITNIG